MNRNVFSEIMMIHYVLVWLALGRVLKINACRQITVLSLLTVFPEVNGICLHYLKRWLLRFVSDTSSSARTRQGIMGKWNAVTVKTRRDFTICIRSALLKILRNSLLCAKDELTIYRPLGWLSTNEKIKQTESLSL